MLVRSIVAAVPEPLAKSSELITFSVNKDKRRFWAVSLDSVLSSANPDGPRWPLHYNFAWLPELATNGELDERQERYISGGNLFECSPRFDLGCATVNVPCVGFAYFGA
jgi:hypothetical protein